MSRQKPQTTHVTSIPTTRKTRRERLGDLVDLAILRMEQQLEPEGSTISASLLRELATLARSAGVKIDDAAGVPLRGPDHVLDSLADLDLDAILAPLDYGNGTGNGGWQA